ncbi:PepSY domain-containing protein [Methylobacterium nigriterrae]|uniref:PepSY domain-containing protein n=1 Tax=Methylobacterium nigriterrae TaxID=3127512 RepID=UPI0030141703
MPRLSLLITVAAAILSVVPDLSHGSEQERAREALERGEIRPLDQVLRVARERVPGEVVKVELEREDGRWVYEIKILTESGKRREVEIDANSLEVLEVD